MALLPSRNPSVQAAPNILMEVKKGKPQARNEFIWQNQERFYAVALMASRDSDSAVNLTIMAFRNALAALKQINPKLLGGTTWDWLSQFIVDACAEFHLQFSGPAPASSNVNPAADGSDQIDWETTVTFGAQRVKRCLSALSEDERNVYILRHQLGLTFDQVATVLNKSPEDVLAWLFRARVQIVECLGRG